MTWRELGRQAAIFGEAAKRSGRRFTVRSRADGPRELRYLLGCMAGYIALEDWGRARLYETVASVQVGATRLLVKQ